MRSLPLKSGTHPQNSTKATPLTALGNWFEVRTGETTLETFKVETIWSWKSSTQQTLVLYLFWADFETLDSHTKWQTKNVKNWSFLEISHFMSLLLLLSLAFVSAENADDLHQLRRNPNQLHKSSKNGPIQFASRTQIFSFLPFFSCSRSTVTLLVVTKCRLTTTVV